MKQPILIQGKIRLKNFDPAFCAGLEKEAARAQTLKWTRRIGEMQELLYANARNSLVILFQGMDASGKDGAVKRLLEFVNPAGVETTNFKAPSAEERAHDFLWRVHLAVPAHGFIGIFNRSHYEDVLVTRVHGLVDDDLAKLRFRQINDFERMLTENGVTILKLFLHMSRGEQKKRLEARLHDPHKNWKFNPDDLAERKYWRDYVRMYEDALEHTNTDWARWWIVPSDVKWYRNYMVAMIVAHALKKMDPQFPPPPKGLDLSKIVIE